MSYMITSRKNETLLVTSDKPTGNENINSSLQKEEPQMFLQFPLPLPNNMEATTILPNLPHQYISTNGCRSATTINSLKNPLKLTNTTSEHLPSKVKSVRKKTIAVKKERQSKIHTAQGLRDRRMRLSVHTARKFFDLNDMLGFDKASKTIEWLFSNSKKAIEEVTETLQSDDKNLPPLSACETEPLMEINAAAEHVANLDLQDDVMEDGKHWQLCKADPSVDFEQPQLGFLGKPDNHNMEELSCYPLDYSNINHCVKHLQLDNNAVRSTDAFLGRITTVSATNCSIFDYSKTIAEPPAGWLNSTNTFLGFHGGWDSENSKME